MQLQAVKSWGLPALSCEGVPNLVPAAHICSHLVNCMPADSCPHDGAPMHGFAKHVAVLELSKEDKAM